MTTESSGTTILVADDESDIVRLASRRLVRAGYTVVTAGDGEEALAEAERTGTAALLLLDVMMPKLTGIEVARRLRSTEVPHVPIVLMSAGLPHDLELPRDADAFVAKPFAAAEPHSTVQAVLSGLAAEGAAAR